MIVLQKNSSVDYILDCLPSLTAAAGDRSSAVLLTGTYRSELYSL